MHNPEFTMLEFYTAYFDCRDVIATTEELVARAARVAGEGPVTYRGREVSFALPFRRVRMTEAIAQVAAEQGWGLDEAALADAAALEAWLRSGPKALAARARIEGRGRLPRGGVLGAAGADVARQAGRAALRGSGRSGGGTPTARCSGSRRS